MRRVPRSPKGNQAPAGHALRPFCGFCVVFLASVLAIEVCILAPLLRRFAEVHWGALARSAPRVPPAPLPNVPLAGTERGPAPPPRATAPRATAPQVARPDLEAELEKELAERRNRIPGASLAVPAAPPMAPGRQTESEKDGCSVFDVQNGDIKRHDLNFGGGKEVHFPADTQLECCAHCRDQRECNAFVFSPKARHCWLKRLEVDREDCQDSDGGATDKHGNSCIDYADDLEESCGEGDDNDFTASVMCIACGGGACDSAHSAHNSVARSSAPAGVVSGIKKDGPFRV